MDETPEGSTTSIDVSENLSNADNCQNPNITDEEKQQRLSITNSPVEASTTNDDVGSRPFLETIMAALDCSENDYMALFALCLLYALLNNKGNSCVMLIINHSDMFAEFDFHKLFYINLLKILVKRFLF